MKLRLICLKTINVTLGLLSGYYVYDSVLYMWEVFSSIYQQTGVVATIISFMLVGFIIRYGFIFLLSPLIQLFSLNIDSREALVENLKNFLLGLVLIQVSVPIASGLIVTLLLKFNITQLR